MSERLNLAVKLVGPVTDHPSAYGECREVWHEFITDPEKSSGEYVTAVTEQVRALSRYEVPLDERTDVIVAAFWAASSEAALTNRPNNPDEIEQTIRTALENVWAEVEDG